MIKRDVSINNEIYRLYKKECNKNILLNKKINQYKLENNNLQYELNYKIKSFGNKIDKAIKDATTPLIQELETTKIELEKAYNEIERLKNELMNYLAAEPRGILVCPTRIISIDLDTILYILFPDFVHNF